MIGALLGQIGRVLSLCLRQRCHLRWLLSQGLPGPGRPQRTLRVIYGHRRMGEKAVGRFQTLIEEARSEGHPVDILVLDWVNDEGAGTPAPR